MSAKNILIVDDYPANLKLLRLLLAADGHVVQTANCAEDALELLSSFRPDVILVDIQMPGMNGLELTRVIKSEARTKEIRILAVSANAMEADIRQAQDAGCEGYITKPIDTRRFVAAVREYLN
jgi:two-component system cell cycle response regulator DivK